MVEGGIIKKMLKKYTKSTTLCKPVSEMHQLMPNQVILPFLILMAGTGFSVTLCFTEIFVKKKSKYKPEYQFGTVQKKWSHAR